MPASRRGSRSGRWRLRLQVCMPPKGALLQLNEELVNSPPLVADGRRAALVPDIIGCRFPSRIQEPVGCSKPLSICDASPKELKYLSIGLPGAGVVGTIHGCILQFGQQLESRCCNRSTRVRRVPANLTDPRMDVVVNRQHLPLDVVQHVLDCLVVALPSRLGGNARPHRAQRCALTRGLLEQANDLLAREHDPITYGNLKVRVEQLQMCLAPHPRVLSSAETEVLGEDRCGDELWPPIGFAPSSSLAAAVLPLDGLLVREE